MYPTPKQIDTTKTPPTHSGAIGHAWQMNVDAIKRPDGLTARDAGSVCSYCVFAPWAHPAWAYYFVMCVHLREIPGRPEPKRALPGATHEIIVAAVYPEKEPDLLQPWTCFLRPLNFVGQWIAEGETPEALDAAASSRVLQTVMDILAGKLSPDTDFIGQWVERFGDACLR